MSALTTREALTAQAQVFISEEVGDVLPGMRQQAERFADFLLASGVVVDAATLADDDALVDDLAYDMARADGAVQGYDGDWTHLAVAGLRALPAALSERSPR